MVVNNLLDMNTIGQGITLTRASALSLIYCHSAFSNPVITANKGGWGGGWAT